MITEDYVSFETAKLLKEKGFDEPIQYFYKFDSRELYRGTVFTNTQIGDKFYNAPTLQMAMKWLREVHKLFIDIFPCDKPNNFLFNIYKIHDTCIEVIDNEEIFHYNTYEGACEATIRYCLENLI